MRRTITLVSLFVIFFTINQTFSAIFWYFKTTSCIDDYTNCREASFHRGLLLSYSTAQKGLLCQDIFSAQLHVVPKSTVGENGANELITDGQQTEKQHALIVSKISLAGEIYNVLEKEELFVKCSGAKFSHRKPFNSGEFYVSYGFHYGRWFASTWLQDHDIDRIVLGQNIGTSPQYVRMDENQLEDRYWATRETIETLRNESPAYIRLVEEKDDLLALTKWHRAVMCASILSSPVYRGRLEYSTNWINEHTNNLEYEEKALTFLFGNHGNENTTMCDCIICKGFANSNDEKSESTDLCVTRSYDNFGSVYIIKLQNEVNSLDKYFQKIAILWNSVKPVPEDSLFKNYNE